MEQMESVQLLEAFDCGKPIRKLLSAALDKNAPPTLVGDYLVIRFLGKGSFGEVFQGRDRATGRSVAIKLIDKAEIFSKYKSESIRLKWLRYLESEEKSMRVCRSANVIKLHSTLENSAEKIFIMEYCRDGGLDRFIETRGSLDEEEAIYILRQLIFGIAVRPSPLRKCSATASSIATSSLPTSSSTRASSKSQTSGSPRSSPTPISSVPARSAAAGQRWLPKSRRGSTTG